MEVEKGLSVAKHTINHSNPISKTANEKSRTNFKSEINEKENINFKKLNHTGQLGRRQKRRALSSPCPVDTNRQHPYQCK